MPDASTQTDPKAFEDVVLDLLYKIQDDTRRNADVACKYGSKADNVFNVVDNVSSVFDRMNPFSKQIKDKS